MKFSDFLKKARKVHGVKYEYVDFGNAKNTERITIICPEHGEFKQTIAKHLSGQGCAKCVRPRSKMTQDEFINECIEKHNSKYGYGKVEFNRLIDKVVITCPIHGDFKQKAIEHLNGQGCPKCRYDIIASKRRTDKDEVIKRFKEAHGDKYDYSKVEYVNSKTPVCIICPEHGEFWQTSTNHLSGNGCPKCSGKHRYNTEEFIQKAKGIHGNRYDYSKTEYINSKTPVCITCPKHGDYFQLSAVHLRGAECLKCSYEKRGKGLSMGRDKFIEKCRKKYGDKYDYSKVNYVNNATPVTIICPEHGEFKQIPVAHLNGTYGCPKCCEYRTEKYTTEEWIEAAKAVHENKYDYSKVEYIDCHTKVCIVCPEHGEFWQAPTKHLSGDGCPSCGNSKLENDVLNILSKNGIFFEREYNKGFGRLRCDFYVKNLNLIIECQGSQHFKPEKFVEEDDDTTERRFKRQLENDLKKKRIAEENGFKMLYYTMYKNWEFKPTKNPLYNGIYTKANLVSGKKPFEKLILAMIESDN